MKNIKISFNNQEFIVNKLNNTVTCILDGTLCLFESTHFIRSVGVAKCNSEDQFSEIKGIKISLAKAENKMYGKVSKIIMTLVEDLQELIENCTDFIDKSDKVQLHNIGFIEKVSNSDLNNLRENSDLIIRYIK